MDQSADDVIKSIFLAAEKDDRSRTVVAELRRAFEAGDWNPEGMAKAVERAINEAMERSK